MSLARLLAVLGLAFPASALEPCKLIRLIHSQYIIHCIYAYPDEATRITLGKATALAQNLAVPNWQRLSSDKIFWFGVRRPAHSM
jgi:hypothetical protein